MHYEDMLMHESYRALMSEANSPNDDSDLDSPSLPDDDLEDDEDDSSELPDSDEETTDDEA